MSDPGPDPTSVDVPRAPASADRATVHVEVPPQPPPAGAEPVDEPTEPGGSDEPPWFGSLTAVLVVAILVLLLVAFAVALVADGGADDPPVSRPTTPTVPQATAVETVPAPQPSVVVPTAPAPTAPPPVAPPSTPPTTTSSTAGPSSSV